MRAWPAVTSATFVGLLGLSACTPDPPPPLFDLDDPATRLVTLEYETRHALDTGTAAATVDLSVHGTLLLAFGTEDAAGAARAIAEFAAEDGMAWTALDAELIPGAWREWRIAVPEELQDRAGLLTLRIDRADPALSSIALPASLRSVDPAAPNIVLISLDTLRADRLGCYGNPRAATPTMDRLAAEGVRFHNVLAQASWTLPSHFSMLTSLYPTAHGLNPPGQQWAGYTHPSHSLELRGSERIYTLAERLADRGYMAAAITEDGWVDAGFGFDQGFDSYVSNTFGTLPNTTERAVRWLDEHRDVPFFLFLHTYQPHQPYDQPEPYRSMFVEPDHLGFARTDEPVSMQTLAMLKDPGFPLMKSDQQAFIALYDGEVRYTDTLVEQVMQTLERNEIAGDTLVILTSDHGEELFEHGGFDHGDSLYDEVMRVPLIFHWPGKLPAGQEVRDPAALIDILPTVVELVGGSAEAPVQGRSLVPYLTGQQPPPDAAEREIYGDGLVTGRGSLWCIWSGRHKYILTRGETDSEELYDLRADPTEQNDLASAKPEIAARLKARIEEWRVANELLHEQLGSAETELDPELLERLRSLGYID